MSNEAGNEKGALTRTTSRKSTGVAESGAQATRGGPSRISGLWELARKRAGYSQRAPGILPRKEAPVDHNPGVPLRGAITTRFPCVEYDAGVSCESESADGYGARCSPAPRYARVLLGASSFRGIGDIAGRLRTRPDAKPRTGRFTPARPLPHRNRRHGDLVLRQPAL